ncbi:MAG: hypothetical protein AAF607_10955 [Pseudomonadota bacterium]
MVSDGLMGALNLFKDSKKDCIAGFCLIALITFFCVFLMPFIFYFTGPPVYLAAIGGYILSLFIIFNIPGALLGTFVLCGIIYVDLIMPMRRIDQLCSIRKDESLAKIPLDQGLYVNHDGYFYSNIFALFNQKVSWIETNSKVINRISELDQIVNNYSRPYIKFTSRQKNENGNCDSNSIDFSINFKSLRNERNSCLEYEFTENLISRFVEFEDFEQTEFYSGEIIVKRSRIKDLYKNIDIVNFEQYQWISHPILFFHKNFFRGYECPSMKVFILNPSYKFDLRK